MIIGNRSWLSVSSSVRTAAEITAVLGLEPHRSREIGDPTRAALAGGTDVPPEALIYHEAFWSFDADATLIDLDDDTGFASLRVLVDVFRDRALALASLRPDCETRIGWSGDSDDPIGTFVIPADLLSDLAALGCDIWGTAYIKSDDVREGDEGSR